MQNAADTAAILSVALAFEERSIGLDGEPMLAAA